MAVGRDTLFYGPKGLLESTPFEPSVTFSRGNPLPLEKYSVFEDYDKAEEYAASNPIAYPGQPIAVVPETGEVTFYIIQTDGSLKKLVNETDVNDAIIEFGNTISDFTSSITAISDEDIIALFE